jgi:hypothetical protein
MDKRIKELAEQAGLSKYMTRELCPTVIERFAELVRQDAMEEAAKICDELNYNGMNSLHCAAAIRNRAEEYLNNDQD